MTDLTRWVAESDPVVNGKCYYCKENLDLWTLEASSKLTEYELGHAPDCHMCGRGRRWQE